MHLLTSHVKKLKFTTIDALDIHPMREKTIFAGGAANGNIYLWNMVHTQFLNFKTNCFFLFYLYLKLSIEHYQNKFILLICI